MRPFAIKCAALLFSFLILSTSASCSVSKQETPEKPDAPESSSVSSAEESETDFMPSIGKKDYQAKFHVINSSMFLKQHCFPGNDEEDQSDINPALHDRAVLIEEQIGVTLVHIDSFWTEYAGTVENTIKSGDDAYQMILTPPYMGLTTLIGDNCLLDLAELPSLNLLAPYWSQSVMDRLSIEGRHLLGYNDFLLSEVDLITFNKDLMKEYGIQEPYDLVRNKKWTIDRLMETASLVSLDLDSDGKMTSQDLYGISGWGWVPLIDFVTASDIRIVDKDENNRYYVSYDDQKERTMEIMEKVYTMYHADYAHFWKSTESNTGINGLKMDTGRSLFGLMSSSDLLTYRDAEVRLGILPYPLFDENQEDYRTLSWNGYLCVPTTVRDQDMVSDTIELLAAYAGPVKVAFYENLLGLKLSEAPYDSEMLDIIWRTQVSDIGLAFDILPNMDNLVYMLPKMCESHSFSYAAYLKRYVTSANKGLNHFFHPRK